MVRYSDSLKEVIAEISKNSMRKQGNPEYNENPPRSKDTPRLTADDDDQQADQSNKKIYIPPIIVDDQSDDRSPINEKQLLEDLNHLTKKQ
ncbi:hypothetical protein CEXT_640551 [Caerostris extrusa]|uniref:Uncharacterized protein n=1 Tax=Caerostris extrusa TaxID=172846 RepID=A0AAV4WZE1_CAEEX|nr:hypothetical protein CEXT_640551 [Caerostris extrusa]